MFNNNNLDGAPPSQNSRIRITGLWKETTDAGEDFLSGTIAGGLRVTIFPNNTKQPGTNAPDFNLYLSGKEENFK